MTGSSVANSGSAVWVTIARNGPGDPQVQAVAQQARVSASVSSGS